MNDKEALKTLIEQVMLKGMGVCLDNGRMSIQNERSAKQFERSTRATFRQLIEDAHKLIDQSSGQPESK